MYLVHKNQFLFAFLIRKIDKKKNWHKSVLLFKGVHNLMSLPVLWEVDMLAQK